MASVGPTPPLKKRRLMPSLSSTQPSLTPSPASTPSASVSSSSLTNHIPHVKSTPIKNYFTQFTPKSSSNKCRRPRIQRCISPRSLWRSSPNQTIPFPPSESSSSPLLKQPNNLKLNSSKYDEFYHPLTEMITKRTDLNVFSSAYLDKSKSYFDDSPFLDPNLQTLQLNNLHKLLCDNNDAQTDKSSQRRPFANITDAASDALQTYGDKSITKILKNNDDDIDIADTPIARAKQFITFLKSDSTQNANQKSSSYDEMKTGVVFLSGILEHIVAELLDASGCLAEFNHSITESCDEHSIVYKDLLNDNPQMITKYDKDVYDADIDRNSFVIRPLHIRHAINSNSALFWLQQSIQTLDVHNEYRYDIEDDLNTDCVYHICSFFCGDLPMLSSLARVNSTFYAMTSSNLLWRPIAQRCFLFDAEIIANIEQSDDIFNDFRSFISLPKYKKLTILRERWMKQQNIANNNDDKFELWVRINPIYNDFHERMYDLIQSESESVDEYVDVEMYDLLRQIREVFGSRNDFMSMQDVLNSVKCFNRGQIEERLNEIFGQNDDLHRVIEVEFNDNKLEFQNALFVELALSQSCLEDDDVQCDEDEHYLWIGRNIVIFAAVESMRIDLNHNHNRRRLKL